MKLKLEKIEPRPPAPDSRRWLQEAEALGFTSLAWYHVYLENEISASFADGADDNVPPMVMHALVNEDGSTTLSFIGSAPAGTFVIQSVDLISYLDGPRVLTTTTHPFVAAHPELGLCKYSHPQARLSELAHRHHQYIVDLDGLAEVFVKTTDDFEQSLVEGIAFEERVNHLVEEERALAEARNAAAFAENEAQRISRLDPGDPLRAIRAARTSSPRHELSTSDVVSRLQKWRGQCLFQVVSAERDRIELRFETFPADMRAFVRELVEFCPDLLDLTGDPLAVAGSLRDFEAGLREDGSLLLWWP